MQRSMIVAQRLVAVFLLGLLLFNYPILSLFNQPRLFVGVPVLLLYIFAVWIVVILVAAWVIETRRGA